MAGKDERPAILDFIDEHDVGAFEHVIDDSNLWQAFDIRSQPSFAFIDDDGTIERHRGRLGSEDLLARVERLANG